MCKERPEKGLCENKGWIFFQVPEWQRSGRDLSNGKDSRPGHVFVSQRKHPGGDLHGQHFGWRGEFEKIIAFIVTKASNYNLLSRLFSPLPTDKDESSCGSKVRESMGKTDLRRRRQQSLRGILHLRGKRDPDPGLDFLVI